MTIKEVYEFIDKLKDLTGALKDGKATDEEYVRLVYKQSKKFVNRYEGDMIAEEENYFNPDQMRIS